jgi:hypothetical protein
VTDNGWNEYKLLFLAETEENRKFREETRNNFQTVNTKLTEISTERRVGKWVLGFILPAVVAALVTGVAKAMGF